MINTNKNTTGNSDMAGPPFVSLRRHPGLPGARVLNDSVRAEGARAEGRMCHRPQEDQSKSGRGATRRVRPKTTITRALIAHQPAAGHTVDPAEGHRRGEGRHGSSVSPAATVK